MTVVGWWRQTVTTRRMVLWLWAAVALAQSPAGQQGRQFYLGHCAHCHGPDGEGGRGVNLTTGQYRLSRTDDDLLRVIQTGVPGTEMPPSRLPVADIRLLVTWVRSLGAAGALEKAAGDASAGALVYRNTGCARCHSIQVNGGQAKGGSLGPALDSIGLRRSLKFLRDSLVTPDAYIAREYVGTTAQTKAGQLFRGLRLNEDDYSLQLRDADERLHSFRKSSLAEYQRLDSSLMPSYGKLSPTDLNNLIAYLSSLRAANE